MEVLRRLVFKNFTQKALALAFAIVLVAMKRGAEWVTQQGLHSAKRDDDEDKLGAEEGKKGQGKKRKGDEKGKKGSGKGADAEAEAEAEGSAVAEEDRYRSYASFRDDRAKRVIGGAIFQITLDTTHPIG